jgi:hypothetical protein
MAGSLFGLGLSQQADAQGNPVSGALLYIYEANTSTPASTYADFALSSEQAWPIEADSAGRIPAFWVDDGSYRARLTTSAGVEIFDEQSITSIGASSGSGGSDSVSGDTSTIFQTGDMLWLPISGTRSGWVRANGRTIGNGSSGATERANGDAQALFEYLWNNFSNSLCAVSSGRGASATADFNAAKTIATLDMRSKGILGLDTMGNTAASVTGGSSTAADAIGASTYTIVTANLPSTNLSLASLTITMSTNAAGLVRGSTTATAFDQISDNDSGAYGLSNTPSTVTITASATGSIPLGGSGTDIDILPPVRVGTFYFKL